MISPPSSAARRSVGQPLVGRLSVLITLALLSGACARGRAPLPGDSVGVDGAVAVAPPPVVAVPAAVGVAPAPRSPTEGEPRGPIERRLIAAETLMEQQAALGLDEKQRTAIMTEVQKAQADMGKVRWELEREREALAKLLDGDPIDEAAALTVASRLSDAETKIKRTNLAMLIRVKNTLTPAQRKKALAAGP